MTALDLRALAARTGEIYQLNAARFDRERSRSLIERGWLERFCAGLPEGGHVLDAGCGAGEPIARYLIERGFALTGLDISPAMLAIAKARFGDQHWVCADMRKLAFRRRFDGIIAWHSFFHLPPEDHAPTLAGFAAHLVPGGMLMVTTGPEAGEVVGHVGDDLVYHASLAPSHYEPILAANGMQTVAFVAEDPECDGASVLQARRIG